MFLLEKFPNYIPRYLLHENSKFSKLQPSISITPKFQTFRIISRDIEHCKIAKYYFNVHVPFAVYSTLLFYIKFRIRIFYTAASSRYNLFKSMQIRLKASKGPNTFQIFKALSLL